MPADSGVVTMDPWLRDRLGGSGDRGSALRRRGHGVGRAAPVVTRRQRRDVDAMLAEVGRELRARRLRRTLWRAAGVIVLAAVGAAALLWATGAL
jgi:hypothetical protein